MSQRFSYQTYGQEPKVTPTGRAKSPGRVTRALTARCAQGAPLSIDIACHPKALSPTSHNPGCVSVGVPWGERYRYHLSRGRIRGARRYFLERTWPTPQNAKYALYVQDKRVFATDDMMDAFGWRMAAKELGLICNLFIEGGDIPAVHSSLEGVN